MISSHSWIVDLSEKEDAVEADTDTGATSLEEPYPPANEDFPTYWEHDYEK